MSGNDASWRLLGPSDLPFVYEVITAVDPRWWRFSRHSLDPRQSLATMQAASAAAIVLDEQGTPVACAILAETGVSETGMFDFFALPNPRAEALARRFAPELVGAAFAGATVRRLYHERFENDPELMSVIAPLFEVFTQAMVRRLQTQLRALRAATRKQAAEG